MTDHFDVLVLGAGSAGAWIAESAARGGLSTAAVESRLVGGNCPYYACMPSKAMLHAAHVRTLLTGTHPDLGNQGGAARDYASAILRRDVVAEQRDDAGAAARLEDSGVRLFRGRGVVTQPGVVEVDGSRLLFDQLVIASGSVPRIPVLSGLDRVDAWNSDQALSTPDMPGSVVILGGGAVGIELAQAYAAFEIEVQLVQSRPRLLPREEPALTDLLAERLRSNGVTLHLGVDATRVEPHAGGVKLHLKDGRELCADRLITATGRRPNVSGAGLEVLGIPLEEGGITVDANLRVSGVANCWAAGDVTGKAQFTHTANYHARVVGANLLGGDIHADHRFIPRAVFTEPPLAAVGLTAEGARAAGIDVVVSTVDPGDTARAFADGEAGGMVTLVADRARGVLVGASAIGPRADEWISHLVLAVRAAVPLTTLADTVFPFPTLSEASLPAFWELERQCRA
ncbi:MAG: dihydrolipoyl dehydrogenase family protein [Candidatus Dormibacteria bacterium]